MLNIAIVGTGGRGVKCFGELLKKRTDCVIKAVCDINKVRARLAAEQFGVEKYYTDLTTMLESEKLDGLIITTPDANHEASAVNALQHGVNILLDKPLSPSLAGCKHIIEEAKKSGKIAMMGFNLRHAPMLKYLKKTIDEGALGRIIMMENREFYDGGRTYMARWNGKKSESGGLWIHKGSHDFDIFNWFVNFPKPKKVSAFSGMSVFRPEYLPFEKVNGIEIGPCCSECYYGKNGICKDVLMHTEEEWGKEAQKEDGYVKDSCMYLSDLSVHDNGIAMVEYENGIRASHIECFVTGFGDRLYTIVGTKAIAQASLANNHIKIINRWSREEINIQVPVVEGGHNGADPALVDSFIKTINGEASNTTTLEQGMLSTAIAEAAELSKEENRTVFIEL